ncbi:hypothetical protein V8E54_014153 [Elaphomyces granulatus]
MVPDDAPPPYTPTDPMLSWNNGGNNGDPNLITTVSQDPQLPPNFAAVVQSSGDTISTDISKGESTTVPNHFASAAGYFASQESLVHHLTTSPRSQGKDFPRRPRCWNARADEVTQHDWNTFLNFMFPPHLAPTPPNNRLPRKMRTEVERDQKDDLQETEEDRVARLTAIVAEWNEGFFKPRALSISWVYVAIGDAPPLSPLCPNCYPAATRAYQNRRRGRSRSVEGPIPSEAEAPVRSNTGWTIPRKPVRPQVNDNTVPVGPEFNTSSAPFRPFKPYSQSHHWMTPLPGNWPTPGLDHDPFSHTQPFRGQGPLAWAATLSARAQEYAERVSEQAQVYGKLAEAYAMAHGQRIEEYAQVGGKHIEAAGDRFNHFCSRALHPGTAWGSWPHGRGWKDGSHWGGANTGYGHEQAQHSRSLSRSSSSSEESLSSIDSLSTASDLDPDDLATTRAQLLSLDTYHDRDLHSAAVGLRNHLRVLQHARREGRNRGDYSHGHSTGRACRGRHRSSEDERVRDARRMEMHALREEFRAVHCRARRETRELQRERRATHRSRRNWWHGHRQSRPCLRTPKTNPATPDSISPNTSLTAMPRSNTATTETSDDSQNARTKEAHKLLKAQHKMARKQRKQKEKEEKRAMCGSTSGSANTPAEWMMNPNAANGGQQ